MKTGDKVVCINDSKRFNSGRDSGIKKGDIYTVSFVDASLGLGEVFIELEERPINKGKLSFNVIRFRKSTAPINGNKHRSLKKVSGSI